MTLIKIPGMDEEAFKRMDAEDQRKADLVEEAVRLLAVRPDAVATVRSKLKQFLSNYETQLWDRGESGLVSEARRERNVSTNLRQKVAGVLTPTHPLRRGDGTMDKSST